MAGLRLRACGSRGASRSAARSSSSSRATPPDVEKPLLNHLGVLVDEAAPAQELGVEVADVVDAPNTFAVFVWGPDRVKLEYVEHKATFSLR